MSNAANDYHRHGHLFITGEDIRISAVPNATDFIEVDFVQLLDRDEYAIQSSETRQVRIAVQNGYILILVEENGKQSKFIYNGAFYAEFKEAS